jgi:hypothetical protein
MTNIFLGRSHLGSHPPLYGVKVPYVSSMIAFFLKSACDRLETRGPKYFSRVMNGFKALSPNLERTRNTYGTFVVDMKTVSRYDD